MNPSEGGEYFSITDQERMRVKKTQTRQQQNNLRSQFMEKARDFMDQSALGEFRKQPETVVEAPAPLDEEEWDDDWEGEEEEELDYSAPETIRVGYVKPGSKAPPKRKSLDEARDESFDLKLGALSGLLNRFGAERTEDEPTPEKQGVHMDMDLFQRHMQYIFQQIAAECGEPAETNWLQPEILTLLRLSNPPEKVMNFMIAAVFAATPENFITRSDLAYITRLLHQIGLDIPAVDVEEAVSHTFLFIERVHHLYQHLRTSPPHLPHAQMHDQKQNLAKLVIHRMAQKWDTEHKHVIKTLALKWLSLCEKLEIQHQEIERLSKQLALFEERKTTSATIFARTVQAEEQALHSWQQLKTVAEDIADLRRVTRMLEEENALNKLHQFPIESLWPEKFTTVETGIPSWQEMQTILKRTQNKQTTQASQTVITASPPLDHSPLYQKKLISRAKQKDLKALKEISAAKTERIAHLRKQMPGRSEHFK